MKKSDKIILGIYIVMGIAMIIIGVVMNVDYYSSNQRWTMRRGLWKLRKWICGRLPCPVKEIRCKRTGFRCDF